MNKKLTLWLLLIFFMGIINLSCSTFRFTRQEKDAVVARVNGQEISLESFEKKSENWGYYSTSPKEDLEKKRAVLDALIIDVIVKQKAQARDLSGDTLFQRNKAQYMEKVLLDLLYEKEIVQKALVTPEEVEEYYQEHPYEFYRVPDKVKASRILIKILAHPSSPDYPEEEQKALNKISMIRQRIVNGEEFGRLAVEFSGDKLSAKKGGEMVVLRGTLIPEFEDFLFSASLNELSQPIKSPQGYNLLIVHERTKGEKRELDEDIRMRIREFLEKEKRNQQSIEYVEKLKEKADFVFNQNVLTWADSLISDNPWVLIINQQDTVWYDYYRSFLKSYRSYIDEDTLSLENEKDFLKNAPLVANSLLSQKAKAEGYLKLPEYLEKERSYTLNNAERKIKADIENEVKTYKPTEEEVYDYYLTHRESYPTDSSIHVYHILFQDSLLAENVREKILNGAEFVEMAEKYHSQTKPEGETSYDLGFISDQKMPKEFYKTAVLLQVGEVSHPVRTEYGYHLIKLKQRAKSPLDPYKPGIRNNLVRLKARQAKERWEKKLLEESDIWIDANLLEKIELRKK